MAERDDMTELAEERTEAADRRTDFAEDRTVQATERTFAGWLRTAFAAIAVGIGFQALFGEFDPPWLAKAIATLFILLGMTIALTAERRACHTFTRLSTHKIERPEMPNIRWMSWSVILGGALLIAGLWILNDGSVGDAGQASGR
jgi:putative membrane protein